MDYVAALLIPLCVVSVAKAGAAELTAVEIGRPDAEAADVLKAVGDSVVLTARGKGAFTLDDRGNAFAYVDTDAQAFTFTARVAKAPADAKCGLALRTGVGRFDRMIAARHVADAQGGRIVWLLRHGPAKSTHDGSQRLYHRGTRGDMNAGQGFWLKLVRRYPSADLSYSTDGRQWRDITPDYHLALLEQKVKVGLILAGGAAGSPVTATFDHVSFAVDKPAAPALSRESFAEYRIAKQPWQMFLIQADSKRRGPDAQAFFILKPKALAWKDVRAAIYTTGSKEIKLDDNTKLAYENGPQKRRRPNDMPTWEGVYEIDNLRPWYQILAHYRLVRLGSPGRSAPTETALREMAEKFNAPQIANLPLMATGESATGGLAARTANLFPKRIVATVSVLIGTAAADMNNADALQSPRLYIYGSRDSGRTHHRQALANDSVFREHRALWACAPMWQGYHRWWYTDRLMTPYFLRLVDLRVPADMNAAAGPVALKPLKEEDGYLGLNTTWDTSFPQAVAWKDAAEAQRRGDTSWLPDALTARIWQCFVSQWPKTVVHFPRYDGSGGFGHVNHPGRENHFLPADEPWHLVASGPLGKDLKVEYYAGLKRLKVLKTYGKSPYVVQLEALPPGLHAIYAITTVGEEREISHPSVVMFQKRRK